MSPELLVIAGPTGSGKSALAILLAEAVGGEIVNCDSVQIYRGFDVGSAKPNAASRARVPHHLYDILEPDEEFTAADYVEQAGRVCREILSRGRTPILVGGTGFYVRAFLTGLPELPERNPPLRERLRRVGSTSRGQERLHRWLRTVDPVSGARIALKDRHRVERALEVYLLSGRPISLSERPSRGVRLWKAGVAVMRGERAQLVKRLDARVEWMYANGLIEETRALLAAFPATVRPFSAIGYREAILVLHNELTQAEAVAMTKRRTRAYAKRQMTWWRNEAGVIWLDSDAPLAVTLEQLIREVTSGGSDPDDSKR